MILIFQLLVESLVKKNIDIAIVPSSDWKRIDYIHGKMARVHTIERGYSLLRTARGTASFSFDAYGRVHVFIGYFDANEL